jgi:hypothetical protein
MNTDQVVAAFDDEIEKLQRVRSLLLGQTVPLKRGMPAEGTGGPEEDI